MKKNACNIKKDLSMLAFVLVIALVGYIAMVELAFSGGFLGGNVKKYEEIKKSSLGDEFLFKYEERDFPDAETVVDIMDSEGKELITFLVISDKPIKPDFVLVLDLPGIRCYECNIKLIYKVGNDGFKGVDIDEIADLEPEEYPTLVEAAKALVATKQWKWVEACGSFLLKAGDEDTKIMLGRYALGEFTQDELDINKDSEIIKEDMIFCAKQVLEQAFPNTHESTVTETPAAVSDESAQDSPDEPAKPEDIFYGTWRVEKWIPTHTISDASVDTDKLIGLEVTFGKDLAISENGSSIKPYYDINTISLNDFIVGHKIYLEEIGVNTDSITQVIIYKDEEHRENWDSVGSFFYIKDENTLVIFVGGNFMEMVRVE